MENEEVLLGIQDAQTKCLTEIDKLCRENNLHYVLAYGTMLGAIRHNGPIPWDDDVDIHMPYEDCIKLKRLMQGNSRYFFQDKDSNPETPFVFFKIRINGTRMQEPKMEKLKMHQGIWIDIFPYFDAPKSKIKKKMQFKSGTFLQTIRCKEYNKSLGRKNIISFIPAQILSLVEKSLILIIRVIGDRGSKEYFILSNDTYKNEFIERNLFDKTIEHDYSNQSFLVSHDYDSYLKKYYGADYMIPRKWSHLNNYADVLL